jgi:D-alanine-D-alanine ligase
MTICAGARRRQWFERRNKLKTQVAILFGGRSSEHEVSLMSARSILEVLDRQKYDVISIGITREGEWLTGDGVLESLESGQTGHMRRVAFLPGGERGMLYSFQPGLRELCAMRHVDVVFPVLHGPNGEDGVIQGALQAAGGAYVGAGVLGSAVGMDKAVFKALMRAVGIPVVTHRLFSRKEIMEKMDDTLPAAEAVAPYPLFTKPSNMGSSVGIMKCNNREELRLGLLDAARYDQRVLVERGLRPRELEVSVLGGNGEAQASVAGEIIPHDAFYTYEAKYTPGNSDLLIPADLDDETAARVRALALQAFHVADGYGMARVDFLLDRDSGELFLSELNTIPGFTRTSMYPRLWQASGLSYAALVERLVELASQRVVIC